MFVAETIERPVKIGVEALNKKSQDAEKIMNGVKEFDWLRNERLKETLKHEYVRGKMGTAMIYV